MITITVNGQPVEIDAPEETPLLSVLRDRLGLTGTKVGCGDGECGVCTVHLDGIAATACTISLSEAAGGAVTTIEGLDAPLGERLKQAWLSESVSQCGYCQPGQLMRAAALLARNPSPTREEIVAGMNGGLCRCGTYLRIIRAIEKVAAGA